MRDALKIPIIRLYDSLIVSIQVTLSDHLVLRLKEDVALEIERGGANGLIIDVSGVDLMDSYISRTIHDIALISRLMGVETVITGMQPAIAMTLVEMGMVLEGVRTALNLESALEHLSGSTRRFAHEERELVADLAPDAAPEAAPPAAGRDG